MNTLYKVGIVGYGVVGRGVHRLFEEMVTAIYDPLLDDDDTTTELMSKLHDFPEDLKFNDKDAFMDLDMVVICVPTDEKPNWEADVSVIWESLRWLVEVARDDTIYLIKSTTPPTELRMMEDIFKNVVFSPEYMGESRYYTPPWKYPHPEDMKSHTWQTFGGKRELTSRCVDIFKRKMGVDTQYWQTDIVTASLAKYIENSFFAMKVTFVNEWFDIAESYGVDWNELRELWLADPRVNKNHTLVFPKDRGYGGKCFPKDTRAIIKDVYESKDYNAELMLAMDKVNLKMRRRNES